METPRIRRPRLTYANVTATFALLIATSMGGAYAHGMIGSSEIQNNAVKTRHIGAGQVKAADLGAGAVRTAKIRNGAVTVGKLAPSARGSVVYTADGHDFAVNSDADIDLPLTPAEVANSSFTVQMLGSTVNHWYQVPGYAENGDSEYRVRVIPGSATLIITRVTGTGEDYDAIKVIRSVNALNGGSFASTRNRTPRG